MNIFFSFLKKYEVLFFQVVMLSKDKGIKNVLSFVRKKNLPFSYCPHWVTKLNLIAWMFVFCYISYRMVDVSTKEADGFVNIGLKPLVTI